MLHSHYLVMMYKTLGVTYLMISFTARKDVVMPDELGAMVGQERWEALQRAKGIKVKNPCIYFLAMCFQ